jgi:hypothetical protein
VPLEADNTKSNGGDQNGNIGGDKASNIGGVTERANTIFKLPSTRQTILYVDIGLVESPFQHTCLQHLQGCVVNGVMAVLAYWRDGHTGIMA